VSRFQFFGLRLLPTTDQFSDPQLRRFNLIAVDARGHGDTTGEIGEYYDQVEAAEDVVKFMASSTCLRTE